VDLLNPALTAATQWFERTLDDSANRRIAVSEAFLATDAILNILLDVCDGLVVYPMVIRQRMMQELPFMATENIMMMAVKKGGNRQELHERLRLHSIEAGKVVKEQGGENDLMARIAADPAFGLSQQELEEVLKPEAFTGLAPEQTLHFVEQVAKPALQPYQGQMAQRTDLRV
jgi:adenylosuccinate lyase